ncbi:carbamoyltransferase [Candidatus Daviesbacteria bacterium]|nr:carbamoyltransferase [Candidatus Daviesbacteria bacterium]
MKKPIYILGISESHCASAALLKDGELIACVSEERFTRKKLQSGIPKNAIKYCFNFAKITASDLSLVALADFESPFLTARESTYDKFKILSILGKPVLWLEEKIERKVPNSQELFYRIYRFFAKSNQTQRQKRRIKKLKATVSLPSDKFKFVQHHLCHASAALFSSPLPSKEKEALIFTCDGVGDFESATLSKYSDDRIKKIVSINSQQSLGFFYQHITQFLGLKPIEDEYKVMGLAPYADPKKAFHTYKLLSPYFKFSLKQNKWQILVSEHHLQGKFPKLLLNKRFDHIAYSAQRIIEELLIRWVKKALEEFKINNLVFGGGVFANVKVNQKIASLDRVNSSFFMPSPGDESNAIGGAFYSYFQLTGQKPKPISHLYLGPQFSEKEIKRSLKGKSKYKVEKISDINSTLARLLAKGEVVARFAGRMEYGARALGNRSILANPKNPSIVEFINSAIKNRDFWMPFAPTILRSNAKKYLKIHSSDSLFMNVSFETTKKAWEDLAAALHPFDKTTRPQILDQEINPSYYDLIKKFEKLTGVGAILNTSFNLHGEPLVASPEDALRVFDSSKLKYLALENILIEKKDG